MITVYICNTSGVDKAPSEPVMQQGPQTYKILNLLKILLDWTPFF
jgi:hypothetical protein